MANEKADREGNTKEKNRPKGKGKGKGKSSKAGPKRKASTIEPEEEDGADEVDEIYAPGDTHNVSYSFK